MLKLKNRAFKKIFVNVPNHLGALIMVVLENQEVVYFDASGSAEDSLTISEVTGENWPRDIKYAIGGVLADFLIIVGGIYTVSEMKY